MNASFSSSFPRLAILVVMITLLLKPGQAQNFKELKQLAFEKASLGEYKAALLDYEQAISLNDKDANAHYYKGVCHFELKEYAAAVESFTHAIELFKRRADYFHNRGKAYYQLSEFDKAIADFDKAISKDRLTPELYYQRGLAKASKGEHVAAIKDYDQSLSLEKRAGEYYRARGESRLALEMKDEACDDFVKARELHAFNARYLVETHCKN